MYPLAEVFPPLQRLGRLPLTRDQLMMLVVAVSLSLTGFDTYLVHSAGSAVVWREWIPVVFGPSAGALLLFAGLIAVRNHGAAAGIATLTLLASIAVGLLGTWYHLEFGLQPDALPGYRVSLHLLAFAPPILGPMMFAIIGVLGMSAAWSEDPPGSGVLRITQRFRLRLPYSKTRAYFFIVAMASLATVVSNALDHSHLSFPRASLLAPVAVGIFATTVAATLGALERPGLADYRTYVVAMLLLILIGPLGAALHIESNLVQGQVVVERLLRGAPLMAPLLFSNVGLLGLLVLLEPADATR